MKECLARRERKRRYALAKAFLLVSLFVDARPRSRFIPECSFGQSLPANTAILVDAGLRSEDGSVYFRPWITNKKGFKKCSRRSDAISREHLYRKEEPRDND